MKGALLPRFVSARAALDGSVPLLDLDIVVAYPLVLPGLAFVGRLTG